MIILLELITLCDSSDSQCEIENVVSPLASHAPFDILTSAYGSDKESPF